MFMGKSNDLNPKIGSRRRIDAWEQAVCNNKKDYPGINLISSHKLWSIIRNIVLNQNDALSILTYKSVRFRTC